MKLIFLGLLLLSLIASLPGYTQTNEKDYCLPISKARLAIGDALIKHGQDTLIHELRGKVDLLEGEKITIYRDFTALLASERTKTSLANQVSHQQKLISQSHEKENKELRKKNRSLKWQRNGAVVIGLLLSGVAIAK